MFNYTMITVEPANKKLVSGDHFSFLDQIKESIQEKHSRVRNLAKFIGEIQGYGIDAGYLAIEDNSVTGGKGNYYVAVFVKKGWYVTIEIYGMSMQGLEKLVSQMRSTGRNPNYIMKTVASEEFLFHWVKKVAEKIR